MKFRIPKKTDFLWGVSFALPAVVFFRYAMRWSANIPWKDDYPIVLEFLNGFLGNGSLQHKLWLVVEQTNEHRIILIKLLALVQYVLLHEVNFKGLVFMGNLGYILFVYLLVFLAKKADFTNLQILPLPYILFSLTQYQNIVWAAAQVYYWSALFALFFLIALTRKNIFVVIGLYALNLGIIAGGLILYPIGLLFLLLEKRYRDLLVFFCASSILTGLYFFRYSSPEIYPSTASIFMHLDRLAEFFFVFLGNAALSSKLAIPLGILVVMLLGLIFYSAKEKQKLLYLCVLWILFTSAVVAISRNSLGIESAINSRYATYGLITWACTFLGVIYFLRVRGKEQAMLFVTRIMILASIFYFSLSIVRLEVSALLPREFDGKVSYMVTTLNQPDAPNYSLLIEAKKLGIFDYQKSLDLRHPVTSIPAEPAINSNISGVIDAMAGGHLSGWAVIPGLKTQDARISILLKDGTSIIKIPTYMVERPDISTVFKIPFMYDYSGYEAYLNAYAISARSDQLLGIMVENGKNTAISWQTVPAIQIGK